MTTHSNFFQTDDVRITSIDPLISPAILIQDYPASAQVTQLISETRHQLHDCITGKDDRLAVIIGPCSIHDTKAAKDYAQRLRKQMEALKDDLIIVMRVYFEKPRTTVGWKGLINDPLMDNSYDINRGLRTARGLLLELAELGVPASTEFLDVITPQYIADLIAWGAIGARTTESQIHRELASGLSMPVGFKNGTSGSLQIAADAIISSSCPHCFLSVTKQGVSAIVSTAGNQSCQLILRGSSQGPNYSAEHVEKAWHLLQKSGISNRIMVDCSHGNSKKDWRNQKVVAQSIADQLTQGSQYLCAVMIESNIEDGAQKGDQKPLIYGQSITDQCIGWEGSVEILNILAEGVRARRSKAQA